jgi:hypothetical protein
MNKTIDGVTYAKTVVDHIYIAVDTKKGQQFFVDFNRIYAKCRIGGKILADYQLARLRNGNLYYSV